MNQPQNDTATVTRDQAIKLARESAFAHSHQHAYLPQTREEADRWQPHEWVLLALQAGALPKAPAATHDTEALISIRNQLHQMSAAKDLGDGWTDAIIELIGEVQTLIEAGTGAHRVLTCVYCGHEYPQDTPASGHQVLTDHISACQQHPMRQAEHCIAVLRAALEGIVGVSERKALLAMDAEVRALGAPVEETAAMLGGIQALLTIDASKHGALAHAAPGIDLAIEHKGMRVDYHGLLRQAQDGLRGEPGLAEMIRQLNDHLTELGRRWYTGDRCVVDEFLQLYCIEPDARRNLIDASPKGGSDAQVVPYQRALDLIGDAYNAGTHGIGYSQQAMELHDAMQDSPKGGSDALRTAAGKVLAVFAAAYRRNGVGIDEIQNEYGGDGTLFAAVNITHGDVVALRDALAETQATSAEVGA